MIPEKRKNKELSMQGWLYRFVSPLQMDLVIPRSLETCAELLQSQHNNRFWVSQRTIVELTELDDDTYAFYIQRVINRSALEADGYLSRWEGDTTYITAEIQAASNAYAALLMIFICLSIFFILTPFRFFPEAIIFFAGMMFLGWHSTRNSRYDLRHWIMDVLQPEIRKKKKR